MNEPQPGRAGTRVLFVEDDAEIRLTVREFLEELGFEVIAYATGEEAAEAHDRMPFDVLFTDVTLPGMSGLALARRCLERHRSLRVVLASGHGTAIRKQLTGALEAAICLPKPYALAAIEQALALPVKS